MKGIYRITFGNKYYIGQCKRLAARVYQHERSVNGCMDRYRQPRPSDQMYMPWAQYLLENPMVVTGKVELIQRSITAWDLFCAEEVYLSEHISNPDCLNRSDKVSTRHIDDDLWDIELDTDGIHVWNFDPREPAKRWHQFWPLKVDGHPKSEKTVKREGDRIRLLASELLQQDTTP